MKTVFGVMGSCVLIALVCSSTYAGLKGKITATELPSGEKEFLHFDHANEIDSDIRHIGKKDIAIVILEGVFDYKNWTLAVGAKKIPVNPENGKFRAFVGISQKQTILNFLAVSPEGETKKQRYVVQMPDWGEFERDAKIVNMKRSMASAGIGTTLIQYKETRKKDYEAIVITAKAAYNYLLFPPKWDLGFSAYGTVAALTTNQPGLLARFFGLNARLGFAIPLIKDPWQLKISTGVYYTTMMVTGKKFGFQNMFGPQLYPSVRYRFASGKSISSYAKLSPVSATFSTLSFEKNELAAGVMLGIPVTNGHMFTVSTDISRIYLTVGKKTVENTTVSLSVGWGI